MRSSPVTARPVGVPVTEPRRAQRSADGIAVDRLYSGFGWLGVSKFATPAVSALESEGGTIRVTASFGIAGVRAPDRLYSERMARADDALYQAKAGGRNRVVVWREGAPCAG
jgi:GGDEF domain-containing protein